MEVSLDEKKDKYVFKRQYKNQNLYKLAEFREWYKNLKEYVDKENKISINGKNVIIQGNIKAPLKKEIVIPTSDPVPPFNTDLKKYSVLFLCIIKPK